MVSHVDDDHIKGILELTAGQLGNSPEFRLKVASLWHNSFDDLLTTTPEELLSGLGSRRSGWHCAQAGFREIGIQTPDEESDEEEAD